MKTLAILIVAIALGWLLAVDCQYFSGWEDSTMSRIGKREEELSSHEKLVRGSKLLKSINARKHSPTWLKIQSVRYGRDLDDGDYAHFNSRLNKQSDESILSIDETMNQF
jgi:hypothetical protein